jgi:pimeloyl-ACP methyl ester carboxylesterase
MGETRKLAAIMAVDVVGYSRLMGEDEAGTAQSVRDVVGDFDITDLVSKVKAPTLVMHVRDDVVTPLEAGRQLAAGISLDDRE